MALDLFEQRLAAAGENLSLARARSAEESFEALTPLLPACGITRVTSVTYLDSLGIPSWVSIRPGGMVLQVSSGKGLTDASARISAVMEAVELHHAEHPQPDRLLRQSYRGMCETYGADTVIPARNLIGYARRYDSPEFEGEWTCGTDAETGTPVWVPSSAVYFFRRPWHHETSSNGLASGNTLAEAELHALYELIERDAMCQMLHEGKLMVRTLGRIIDPATVDTPALRLMLDRCAETGTQVVLISLPSAIDVHTIWAVFLCKSALTAVSTLNFGWGTHVDPAIAATRALTEAAQSRLTFIHGAREDVIRKPALGAEGTKAGKAYRYFEALEPDTDWKDLQAMPVLKSEADSQSMVTSLLSALRNKGIGPAFRFDLTDPELGIPVTRMIVQGLDFRKVLF